jgi:hypothetical protein
MYCIHSNCMMDMIVLSNKYNNNNNNNLPRSAVEFLYLLLLPFFVGGDPSSVCNSRIYFNDGHIKNACCLVIKFAVGIFSKISSLLTFLLTIKSRFPLLLLLENSRLVWTNPPLETISSHNNVHHSSHRWRFIMSCIWSFVWYL